ncbi:MAG: hypothetical protein K5839_03130 [Treponemataceae bacterium]|nr:hypothetical protein [Treponemataceae bacterium]
MAKLGKLMPKDEIISSLTYREQKKLINLIIGDIICMSLFFVFTCMLFAIKVYLTGALMLVADIFFITSISLTKRGHMILGSYMATIGYITACIVVGFFVRADISVHIGYRTACFFIVMGILNAMVSIKDFQILLFYTVSQILFFVSQFTVYLSVFQSDIHNGISVSIIGFMGMLFGNLALYYTSRLNTNVVEHSEKEHLASEKNLSKITDVLSQTKESLNIGQKLNDATDTATESINMINGLYRDLMDETVQLKQQTEEAKSASAEVTQQAGKIGEGIQDQNMSLDESSSAMVQISSNISQINVIAEKRRQGMSQVVSILDDQGKLITKLVNDFEKVKESSKGIANFVQTVDSIAGQTNLLAMNASIEAAHAGTMGKGFGVIAQEIRKLSEETSKNASKIADTLKENTVVVQETSNSVTEFAKITENSAQEIRESVISMEEILRGISEMNNATQEVTKSVRNVVEKAKQNQEMIDIVSNKISAQDSNLTSITSSTEKLEARVHAINDTLGSINSAIGNIQGTAEENKDVSEKIAALLD